MTILVAVPDHGEWRFDDDQPAALTASAIPVKPPQTWFDDPGLTGPTAMTVTPEGRVYGHAAAWGVRHIGLPGCRTAPRSKSGYAYYRTGQVETAEGAMVATGRVSMGGGHADINGDLTAAVEHYDDVTAAVADVAVGEDSHGIWFAGALRPDATAEQIRTLRASSVSGDWRSVDGRGLEMCGLLAVNVPGFSVPRANLAASGAEVTSLVAAGALRPIITIRPAETEETPMGEKTQTPTDTTDTPAEPDTPTSAEQEDTAAEGQPHPAGNLVSIRDGEFVGLVTDTDTHDPDTVAVQIEVPRQMVAAASPEQRALVSSAVQQRMRDRELDAKFSELAGRVSAAETAAENAWAHARGVEAMADLDGIA